MIVPALALAAGYGVHLIWTAITLGWTGVAPGPTDGSGRRRVDIGRWLAQAGLDQVTPVEFVAVTVGVGLVGGVGGYAVFGAPAPALLAAAWAGSTPVGLYRSRRRRRMEVAQEAWPRVIEEIRLLTGAMGQSIPQALFAAGSRAPEELRNSFELAHREWLLTTDFARTTSVLKDRLADPTADAACETLLVAHEVGGTDLDRRLGALVEDRIDDLQGRRDGRARQAGVRFARRFVVIVPLGMAAVGLSVGTGREAYRSAGGQVLVVIGLAVLVGCWAWSGRIMAIPDEERVFP